MSLSSLIVQREIASIRAVEEALARQVLYGGDLATNLLEVAQVEEDKLARAVAEEHGLPAAPFGELPMPTPSAREVVPTELAVRRSMLPLDATDDTLTIVLAEPLAKADEEQLAFALGLRIDQRIALYARVRQGLAKAFELPLERRVERLLARLAGEAPTSGPTSQPPLLQDSPEVQPPPRPPSVGPARHPTRRGFPQAEVVISELEHAAETSPAPPLPTTSPAPPLAVTAPAPKRKSTQPMLSLIDVIPSPPQEDEVDDNAPTLVPPRLSFKRPGGATPRPARRRRGPLTFDAAREELESATERDALLDLLFDFARQFFDYSALFLVQADTAEGRDAFGDGLSREHIVSVAVPLATPSVLATAREKKSAQFAAPDPAPGENDAILLSDLEREGISKVFVLPIIVRGRVVALLYADAGPHGVEAATVKEVIELGKMIGVGFEKIIVRKKLHGFSGPGSAPGSTGPAVAAVPIPEIRVEPARVLRKSPTPSPDLRHPDRAEAFKRAILGEVPAGAGDPLAPPGVPVIASPSEPVRRVTALETPVARGVVPPVIAAEPTSTGWKRISDVPPELAAAQIGVGEPKPPPQPQPQPQAAPKIQSRPPPHAEPSFFTPQPPPAAVAQVRPMSGRPIPREEPEDVSGAAVPDDEPPEVIENDDEEPVMRAPHFSAPDLDAVALEDDDATAELLREIEMQERAAFSHSVGPRRPPAAYQLASMPSIIVDTDSEYAVLVDRLLQGDDVAEGELLRDGMTAMPAVMARFPGPLRVHRDQLKEPLPRVGDCGPVLALIARMRRVALPSVLPYVSSDDVDLRTWATFLLVELSYPEAVDPLVPRLFDADPRIRLVARAAARRVAVVAQEALLGALGRVLRDPRATRHGKIGVLETLGDIREPLAVPLLIRYLEDEDEEIATVSRRSLIQITRQDFARDTRRWLGWWGTNANRHRIEWLIDALVDETPGIRRAAGDELKALTNQSFGYYDDLPKIERERSQQRFRDWWASEGRSRFSR
jgi:hypothetical protein